MHQAFAALPVAFCALALIPSSASLAQESVDRAMVEKIRREGLDNSHVYATFNQFVTVIGPRLTATPEYKAAADWSRDQLTKWGLQNARLESWEFGRGWALEKFSIEMIEPRYMPLIGYPEAWSASMSQEVEATPVYIGDKTPEELEAMKNRVAGAILLSQPLQTSFVREDRPQPTDPSYTPPAARGTQPGTGGGRETAAQALAAEGVPRPLHSAAHASFARPAPLWCFEPAAASMGRCSSWGEMLARTPSRR
jgi:hypothetical protein